MKYDKMKLAVGFFIIALFTTLLLSLLFLFKEKGLFEQRYTYNFQTNSAEYFKVGMPLKFSGFTIGSIDDIALKDDGKVNVIFSVKKTNTKWLSEGSVLMIIKPLLGSAHIELFTSIGTPALENGSTLTIIESDSINDLVMKVQPVITKALNILDSINKITTYLASEDSELKKILVNLEKLTAKLANDDSLLTSLTGDSASAKDMLASLNETKKILKDVKSITNDISHITNSLDAKIINPTSASLKEMELIMKDVKQKLDALDNTVKTVGTYDKDLVELKEQISVGLSKSNQIMDKVDSLMSDEADAKVSLP